MRNSKILHEGGNKTNVLKEVHGAQTYVKLDYMGSSPSTSSVGKKVNYMKVDNLQITHEKKYVSSKHARNGNYKCNNIIFLFITSVFMSIILFFVIFFMFLHNNDNRTAHDLTKINKTSLNDSLQVNKDHPIQLPFVIRNKWKAYYYVEYPSLKVSENNTMYSKSTKINKIKFVAPQTLYFLCDTVYPISDQYCHKRFETDKIIGKILGYKDIFYHYIINMDGSIYEGRSIYYNDDKEFTKDVGNLTLIVGISMCHSGNPFFNEKTSNETQTIKNLINYLKNKKILLENYIFEILDYCVGSLFHDLLNEINEHHVTFYNLQTELFYKRYITHFEYAGVNGKIADENKTCSEKHINTTLQNFIFPLTDIILCFSPSYGDICGSEFKRFNSYTDYYNFSKDRIKLLTYNIKYCNIPSAIENSIFRWCTSIQKYCEAKPKPNVTINYLYRRFNGHLSDL